MNRKIAIRFVVGLFTVAALFFGYQFFKNALTVGAFETPVDTTGAVAALQETSQGTKVVVFSASGQKRDLPGSDAQTVDRDFSWSPNGYHLYLSSNRNPLGGKGDKGAFNLFRWKYNEESTEPFSNQRRSQSAPRFGPIGDGKRGVILSGGNVVSFDPITKTGEQIMPPVTKYEANGNQESGAQSGIDTLYSKLGNSFRAAQWTPTMTSMLAVMRRDDGEVFIYHDFTLTEKGEIKPPLGILAGTRVQFDQSSAGKFVIAQQDAAPVDVERPPADWLKDGKLFPNMGGIPLTHMLWYGEWLNGLPKLVPMIPPQPQDKTMSQPAFMDPAISPDGTMFAVVVAQRVSPTSTVPFALLVGPLDATGLAKGNRVATGEVLQPSWSPDSKSIVFIASDGTHRAIVAVNADGTGRRKLADDANYVMPMFSPQSPKKAS